MSKREKYIIGITLGVLILLGGIYFLLGPVNAWHRGDNWEKGVRDKQHNYALDHPEMITNAAQSLFEAIRTADYDHPRKALWHLDYQVHHWRDVWVEWIGKNFKDNPIKSVELGKVFRDEANRPAIPYKLTLKDGTVLEGILPFEYRARSQYWEGVHGLDWHLQPESHQRK